MKYTNRCLFLARDCTASPFTRILSGIEEVGTRGTGILPETTLVVPGRKRTDQDEVAPANPKCPCRVVGSLLGHHLRKPVPPDADGTAKSAAGCAIQPGAAAGRAGRGRTGPRRDL